MIGDTLIGAEHRCVIESSYGVESARYDVSDVNVFVDFAPNATFFDLVRLADFLEETPQCHVDVIPKESLRPELLYMGVNYRLILATIRDDLSATKAEIERILKEIPS